MDSQRDFFQRIIGLLERVGISYMVAGSLSSSYYGKPRSSQDVDIVIDPDRSSLGKLIDLLEPEYYVSRPAAIEELEHRGMFNIIDTRTGWKVDLVIRKARPFSREEFARRRPAELMGVQTWVLSPEDSILSKLEWTKGRQSDLQLQDAIHVVITQWNTLDFDYLRQWAQDLDVTRELDAIVDQARSQKGT
jgi:hypothetical protein